MSSPENIKGDKRQMFDLLMDDVVGSTPLKEMLDKRILVILRDLKNFIGILRSYDQFANIILQDTMERVTVSLFYGEIPRGVFLIRGENVLLLGELDGAKEDSLLLEEVPIDVIMRMQNHNEDSIE